MMFIMLVQLISTDMIIINHCVYCQLAEKVSIVLLKQPVRFISYETGIDFTMNL